MTKADIVNDIAKTTGIDKDAYVHIQSNTCNCTECQEKRSKYVTILDVDRYIESLNDWD